MEPAGPGRHRRGDRRIGKPLLLGLLAAGAAALAACSKPPAGEMTAAREALDLAKKAGAESFAPEAYGKAQEAMTQAKAEMDAQAAKLSPLRSYDRSRQLILKVKGDAEQARSDAAAGKVQLQQEAKTGIDAAKSALADASAALARAPGGKDSKADLEAMRADLTALKGMESEAEAAYASEDYVRSKQRSAQVKQQATAIQADIAAAIQKAHKAPRRGPARIAHQQRQAPKSRKAHSKHRHHR